MNSIKRAAFAVLGLMFSTHGVAQVYPYVEVSLHPSVCEAVNPASSHDLRLDEFGLRNLRQTSPLWVICPIPLQQEIDESRPPSPDVFSFYSVSITNGNNDSVDAFCILDVTVDDKLLRWGQPTHLPANGSENIVWALPASGQLAPAMTCRLEPGTGLASIVYLPHTIWTAVGGI